MLDVAHRTAYNEDHEAFRDTVRKVFAEHMEPFLDDHEADGLVPRAAWQALGPCGVDALWDVLQELSSPGLFLISGGLNQGKS